MTVKSTQRCLYLEGRRGDWTEADHKVEDYLAQRVAMEHPLPAAKIREQIEEDERTIAQWYALPPLSAYGRGVCEWLTELNRIRREALAILGAQHAN